jgi:hypothetical protein
MTKSFTGSLLIFSVVRETVTPAEADVRVMARYLGKLSKQTFSEPVGTSQILPTTEVSSCKGRIIEPLLRRRWASRLGGAVRCRVGHSTRSSMISML